VNPNHKVFKKSDFHVIALSRLKRGPTERDGSTDGASPAPVLWCNPRVNCRPVRVVALTLALATSSLLAAPQDDTAGRVMLATVVNTRGETLVDFGVDDFVVSEGGQDRDVLDVHVADYPIALVIDDLAPPATWAALQSATARFITRIGERPVSITTLSSNGVSVTPLDAERAAALDRLRALAPRPDAPATALPAIAAASRELKATESPFSAIVVVAARAIDATDPVRGDLLPVIIESGANVHVVEARSGAPAVAERADADLLRVIAGQTRGQYTMIYSAASFSIALDRLADRLAAELMIQYLVPPGGRTGDVKVGVRRPGALVLGLGVSR
jgi:hypothetical protein